MTESTSLLQFIQNCPSPFHAVETIACSLRESGYEELLESASWDLKKGGSYFVRRNGSSLISFRIPVQKPTGFLMSAAHSDSPTFKIKANPERSGAQYVSLETEPYGGALLSTWFDRPLTVAGRVLIQETNRIVSRLVFIDRDLLVIPSVAIHMNNTANDGTKILANVDTIPLYGTSDARDTFLKQIADAAGTDPEHILSYDLSLFCRQQGCHIGYADSFILSPKLDDLECVYGCLEGYLQAEPTSSIPVLCVFDNDEVGSGTIQGAGSTFLRDLLRRISLCLEMNEQDHQRLLSGSFLVSADNAHAKHPNHPEYSDANNCPYMNEGIVIKMAASQSYTTDGISSAVFRRICSDAGVPVQVFANRSDKRGGSTLGRIADAMVPVSTLDIGLAQLAMHSAVETAGAKDVEYLVRGMRAFYSSTLHRDSEHNWAF
jgi:aspartyl aminopeptidase